MANEPITTVVGNLTADPELRYVGSGIPVADFTVASTPRSYNRNTQQWDDGETLFLRCTVWREYAENVAESLTKGTRVVAYGKLKQRTYTPRDGGPDRTVYEMDVDEVGPSLRYARAQVARTPKPDQGGFGGQQQAQMNTAPQGGGADDAWGTPATQQQPAQQPTYSEAPF